MISSLWKTLRKDCFRNTKANTWARDPMRVASQWLSRSWFPLDKEGSWQPKKKELYKLMQLIRTHGVKDVTSASPFLRMGFNFRYTDLHASLGLVQLAKVQERIDNLKIIYSKYREALKKIEWLKLVPVHVEKGEVPLYVEVLVKEREKLMQCLVSHNIQTRPIYPDLDTARHLDCKDDFPNTRVFGKDGLVLPCGPDQPMENIERVLESLHLFE